MPTTNSKVFEFQIDQSDYITVDLIKNLDRTLNSQVIASATWTVENEGVATLVGGSPAVDAGGRYVSARFLAVADGWTKITITATAASPTATITEYVLLQVFTPPSSL